MIIINCLTFFAYPQLPQFLFPSESGENIAGDKFFNFIKGKIDSVNHAEFDSTNNLIVRNEKLYILQQKYVEKENTFVEFKIFKVSDSTLIHQGTLLNYLPHGKFISMSGNDTLEVCHFENGNKEGLETITVAQDICKVNQYVKGKLTGVSKTFYKNTGVVIETTTYTNGLKNGLDAGYFPTPDRNLKYAQYYSHGELVNQNLYFFHPDGTLFATGPIKNGVYHGWFKEYNTDGTLTKKIKFRKGRKIKEKHY